jgi:hypothetical protein
MIRALLAVMLVVAFTAEECAMDLEGIINQPGTITVANAGGAESAVIAILADDVRSYPTLGPGGSATVKTNVGGRYEVRVVMTPENATQYRAELQSLRRLVEKAVDGTADPAEKTKLFVDLAGIKAAIRALESGGGAGCTGQLQLSTEQTTQVSATVSWTPTSGGGFWDVTCGSS